MVHLHVRDGLVTFRIAGLHKLWALKSRIVVRAEDIVAVEGADAVSRWAGWRIAGTWVPGFITAGTFRRDGRWIFWDVAQTSAAIVVTLRGHWYSQLIVEVAQPDEARRLLLAATRGGDGASPTPRIGAGVPADGAGAPLHRLGRPTHARRSA